MASYREGMPSAFSSLWLPRTLNRWRRDASFAEVLRRMSLAIYPTMPLAVWIAFTSRAEQNTDTGSFTSGRPPMNCLFHELGWFGIESGPTFLGTTSQVAPCRRACADSAPYAQWRAQVASCRAGPTPSTDRRAPYNNWLVLSSHPLTRQLLGGRNANVTPGNWAGILETATPAPTQAVREASLADQIVLGLVNQLRHGRNVNGNLPARAQARDQSSSWFAFLSFCGWSAGDGLAAGGISRFANQLGAVPESRRVAELVRLTVGSIARARLPQGSTARNYGNIYYLVTRSLQKWQLATDIAASIGEDRSYFDLTPHIEPRGMDRLARAAYGVSQSAAAGIAPAGQAGDEDVGPITGERFESLPTDEEATSLGRLSGDVAREAALDVTGSTDWKRYAAPVVGGAVVVGVATAIGWSIWSQPKDGERRVM